MNNEDGLSIWYVVATLLSLPVLVGLNAFFVAAEFALVAVRRTRIEELQTQGIASAGVVLSTLDHLDRAIAATQLGITIASLGLGWSAESGLAHLFEHTFADFPWPWNLIATHTVAGFIAILIATFLHVVFGELLPKTIALQVPDRVSLWVAKPLQIFEWIMRPIIAVMNGAGNWLARRLGFQSGAENLVHSVEELALLIEDTEEAGLLQPDQAELLHNVFELSDKKVVDCMVPAEKMASLELNTPTDQIFEAVRKYAHTRLPVFEKDPNNIIGIVNTKDLFFILSAQSVVVLEDATYPALFVKSTDTVADVLRFFKQNKFPMALVRDEQDRIAGLITLEDILEEIIGDIEDEHDQPRPVKVKGLKRRLFLPRVRRM